MPVTYDRSHPAIRHLRRVDRKLAAVIDDIGPLECAPPDASPFAFLCFHIVGQMLSTKAADVIYARLLTLTGGELSPERVGALTPDALRGIGLSRRKAEYMLSLAATVRGGGVDFPALRDMPDAQALTTLTALRGIGGWTAKMYLIFMLERTDVLPEEDGAFMQAWRWAYGRGAGTPADARAMAEKWAPWRSVAARYLYRALDTGRVKTPWPEFLKRTRADAGKRQPEKG